MTLYARTALATLAMLCGTGFASAGGETFMVNTGQSGANTVAYYDADSVVPATDVTRVTIDFAKLLVLERPASTVIIGNTAIAEANLSDDRTLILTGKTAGTTNLIVLDADGVEIANVMIEVVAAGTHVVTVHQGVQRQTFSCARRCDPVLSVGDSNERFSETAGQISARHSFAGVGGAAQ